MGLFSRKKSGSSTAELMQQVMTHRSAGRIREALDAATKLDSVLRKEYGERDVGVATNLGVMGELLLQSGEAARAGEVLERARDVWRSHVGESHATFAKSLSRLAEQRMAIGAKSEAVSLLEKAVAIIGATEMGKQHPDYNAVRAQLAALRLP